MLSQAGKRSVTVSSDGFFSDSTAERTVRDTALSMTTRNYQLAFGNGSVMSGAFRIRTYGRYGKFRAEESYKLTLESSGPVIFTDPA